MASERVERLGDKDLILVAIQGYLGTTLDSKDAHELLQAIAELLTQQRMMARPSQLELLKSYAEIIYP